MRILVATREDVRVVEPCGGPARRAEGLAGRRPACLAADPAVAGRAWCGTVEAGILRSDDGGGSWTAAGLAGAGEVTAAAASPSAPGAAWAGTEPSALWRSADGGETWTDSPALLDLPSASEWSFPPRPETHHVRWILPHPDEPGRLWLAIEAGALVSTADGGRTWRDRVPGGPYDTHEAAIHPARPDRIRVAAGDGYYQSEDGGETWGSPMEGLEVGYLRSVAIDPGDPDVAVVSAASHPHSAYAAGRSDGRLYRREGAGAWERVTRGWPAEPSTIAPLLAAGTAPGELWAADERGLHRSGDGGRAWERVAAFDPTPAWLRGLAVVPDG